MSQDHSAALLNLAYGYVLAQALAVAARLRLADRLQAGPRSAQDLARQAGVETAPLTRLLRLLASREIFAEQDGLTFVNTPASEALIGDDSIRDAVALAGHSIFWEPVGKLADSLRTGGPSFDAIFGCGFFDYLARDAAARDVFNAGMHRNSVAENVALARGYPFERFSCVADVGGGRGGFLLEILKAHSQLRGVLFDSSEVIDEACVLYGEIPSQRYQVVGGNFFESVPVAADAILLKRVLHDWDDQQCIRILRNCARAMRPQDTLVVFDAVLEHEGDPGGKKISDVLLLTVLRGRERTLDDFQRIFAEAGLSLVSARPTGTGLFAIEGTLRESSAS
ncbi:O-demethylpuromycin-O-methyltransferase [Candidatus Sulfopaludibacter sp. SbA4]|nr:O-demethylpuromycin-O-methyltransferase [Candidatus Sulfopaludibacter sp. SbA4]